VAGSDSRDFLPHDTRMMRRIAQRTVRLRPIMEDRL
jgi:hypothetical protein